jgi:hypothetical protein
MARTDPPSISSIIFFYCCCSCCLCPRTPNIIIIDVLDFVGNAQLFFLLLFCVEAAGISIYISPFFSNKSRLIYWIIKLMRLNNN